VSPGSPLVNRGDHPTTGAQIAQPGMALSEYSDVAAGALELVITLLSCDFVEANLMKSAAVPLFEALAPIA